MTRKTSAARRAVKASSAKPRKRAVMASSAKKTSAAPPRAKARASAKPRKSTKKTPTNRAPKKVQVQELLDTLRDAREFMDRVRADTRLGHSYHFTRQDTGLEKRLARMADNIEARMKAVD